MTTLGPETTEQQWKFPLISIRIGVNLKSADV